MIAYQESLSALAHRLTGISGMDEICPLLWAAANDVTGSPIPGGRFAYSEAISANHWNSFEVGRYLLENILLAQHFTSLKRKRKFL